MWLILSCRERPGQTGRRNQGGTVPQGSGSSQHEAPGQDRLRLRGDPGGQEELPEEEEAAPKGAGAPSSCVGAERGPSSGGGGRGPGASGNAPVTPPWRLCQAGAAGPPPPAQLLLSISEAAPPSFPADPQTLQAAGPGDSQSHPPILQMRTGGPYREGPCQGHSGTAAIHECVLLSSFIPSWQALKAATSSMSPRGEPRLGLRQASVAQVPPQNRRGRIPTGSRCLLSLAGGPAPQTCVPHTAIRSPECTQ